MNEKISQLIDHELNPHQREKLLEQISNDDVARKLWMRYHLIGSVIRNEVSSTGNDLAGRIRNDLEKEPTILAPLSVKTSTSETKADLWKSVGIFSIAASLVLVAVMTLSPLDRLNEERSDGGNSRVAKVKNVSQFSQEFDEMLVGHAEFTASPGMSGLVGYANLVSVEHLEQ